MPGHFTFLLFGCRALFAECLLNVGETKIQSLGELLSLCDSNGAPGAASGEGRGGGRRRERGGEGSRRGGAGGSVDEGGGGVGATGVRVKEGKGRLVSSCGGGEGAGGKIQSTAVRGSEKGKEIHPYDKNRSEGSSELVGKKRARDGAPSKKRMVSGVSGLKVRAEGLCTFDPSMAFYLLLLKLSHAQSSPQLL